MIKKRYNKTWRHKKWRNRSESNKWRKRPVCTHTHSLLDKTKPKTHSPVLISGLHKLTHAGKIATANIQDNDISHTLFTSPFTLHRALRSAFSLAEVLITIVIIGVVAAILIPWFAGDMNQQAANRAKTVALTKLTNAADMMKADSVLADYTTTSEFADAFQKYIKVAKRCDSTHLTACFSPTFKTGEKKKVYAEDLMTGADFGQSTYTSPNVALVLIDGTSIIMSYNPACDDSIINGTGVSNSLACLSMVYDINGMGSPNKITNDIATYNATLTTCDAGRINNGSIKMCVDGGDTTSYAADGTYIAPDTSVQPNYWAGAIKACSDKGMRLPTKTELAALYDNYKNGGNTLGMFAADYWSATEYSSYGGWYQYFTDGNQTYTNKYNQCRVRCVR